MSVSRRDADADVPHDRKRGASGALSIKALALFDSPSQAAQRTAPVENVILRGEMLYESASYRFCAALRCARYADSGGRSRAARPHRQRMARRDEPAPDDDRSHRCDADRRAQPVATPTITRCRSRAPKPSRSICTNA